ncbi:MAG TPA: phosphatidate cytidylyltransferase [Pirellulales bacterium]|nr:phosphatidate cytidylyltransferase [Pirellulales bacterium]
MTPSAALQSPVFRFYAMIAAGLLVVAGILLAILKFGLRKNIDHAWNSYRGWLMMVPLLIGAIFCGRIATVGFFTTITLFGSKEFARATGLDRDRIMMAVVYLGIVSVGVTSLVADPFLGTPGWYGLFMALPVFAIASIMLVPILRNRVQGQLQTIALAIVGFVYFGWMFGHLGFLADMPHPYSHLFYILFAVELNDIAAFTFGKLFGRHPMRSEISPKKTWEGALGALAVSLVLPWALRSMLPGWGTLQLLLAGVIVGVGGQVGDLAISVIKRDLGIKDMGAVIRGHGGVLDRIDSLIYVAPLFLHMVRYFGDL